MKTSKKLFVAFFAFLLVLMILFLIPESEETKNERAEKYEFVKISDSIPNFNYLIVEKNCRVTIENLTEGTNSYSYNRYKKTESQSPEFHFSGDTLLVTNTKGNIGNMMTIKCNGAQKYMILGYIKFENTQDTLNVSINGGNLYLSKNQNSKSLMINAKNSKINCHIKSLKQITAKLDKSNFSVYHTNSQNAMIHAINHSVIRMTPAKNTQLNKDFSSKYYEMN